MQNNNYLNRINLKVKTSSSATFKKKMSTALDVQNFFLDVVNMVSRGVSKPCHAK